MDEMTLAEAARYTQALGRALSALSLRKYCQTGLLRSRKITTPRGAVWMVTKGDLEAFIENRRVPGRPPEGEA